MSFDYIITGAGSAGCLLANRLTQSGKHRVLLLEFGGRDLHPLIHIPGAVGKMTAGSLFNWQFTTVPQRHLNNRRLYLPQGKGIGGSSSINGSIYIRGIRQDYDHWAQLGNRGWSYDEIFPYFISMEDNYGRRGPYHGKGGPLRVIDLISPHPLGYVFIDAAAELGVPRNNDFNGPQQEGTGHFQQTVWKGFRWSAADAFLRPALRRPNLTVLTKAAARRLTIEGDRVVGVEYLRNGRQHIELADKEVIVTSGPVGSPKLLLLSGIGPAEELREVGVPCVHHLPGVGKNLHDHIDITLIFESKTKKTLDRQDDFWPSILHGLDLVLFRRGLIASTPAQACAYVRSSPSVDITDISLHFLPCGVLDHGRKPVEGHNMTFHNNVMRPRSRGEIRLASSNPADMPLIDPNYAADPYDMQVLIECVKWGRRIMSTKAMKPYVGREKLPGPSVQSDEEIAAYVRQYAETDYHPVGSCKMGNDRMAVVDDQLRVHGLRGLRVADSSIMPAVIGGNTNAPTMMIAAKAADMILNSLPNQYRPANELQHETHA
jgi:choline dehydrogenase-like flavoprotein